MNVTFYATFRDITGQKTVDIDVPEHATIRQLVNAIVERFPDMHDKLLLDNGNLRGYVHVFINGRDAPFLEDQMDTITQPEDSISVFRLSAGDKKAGLSDPDNPGDLQNMLKCISPALMISSSLSLASVTTPFSQPLIL